MEYEWGQPQKSEPMRTSTACRHEGELRGEPFIELRLFPVLKVQEEGSFKSYDMNLHHTSRGFWLD